MSYYLRAVKAVLVAVIGISANPLFSASFSFDKKQSQDAFSSETIVKAMRLACDYQLTTQSTTPANNGWIRAAFYTGVMATYEATNDQKYLDQAMKWGEEKNWTPTPDPLRHADHHCCGQTYAELYMLKHDPAMIQPIRATFDTMMAQPQPGRVDWWWCDSLYMAPPALARLSAATGDPRYTAYMKDMWWDTTEFLYDKDEHLYYRDANYFGKSTKNGKKIFWSRGNGWVMGGIARVLQYLPENDPGRPRFIALFKEMSEKIASIQGEDGLWRPSLADPEEFPMPETSGTGFFTYALAWGINNGILESARYRPVVEKGWKGLLWALDEQGKLGHVQKVAGAPGAVNPEDTHEYAVGAFLLAGNEMLKMSPALGTSSNNAGHVYDFGAGPLSPNARIVKADTEYDQTSGYGWTSGENLLERDRKRPDAMRRDFIFGSTPATFRVDLPAGKYRLTIIAGDEEHGDHVLNTSLSTGLSLPTLQPGVAQYATLTADIETTQPYLEVTFSSPKNNWAVNAVTIEPTTESQPPAVKLDPPQAASSKRGRNLTYKDTWADVKATPNPMTPYLDQFREALHGAASIPPTGLTRKDYLPIIAGNVDFFRQHQDKNGAIIDPYKKIEWQYSTPCYALAAATLITEMDRKDLLESCCKAMDWACSTLSQGKGATNHDDFFSPQIAHALPLLKPLVPAERYAKWENDIKAFNPLEVYRSAPGGGNWNLVATDGEFQFHKLGLRSNLEYVETCIAAQGKFFQIPWGLYCEGPMAYDHFPRLWCADMMASGYQGKNADKLQEMLDRAAITSLFMQSPWGELPAGGRSAHHQWNEAEQCVTYEIYASKARKAGDDVMAGVYKRAAHLAMSSMKRWIRPSGEMWIVKNRVDPAEIHGYEGYSAHSQYNLLPMAMLSIAYQYAEPTEDIAEVAAPADLGGFAFSIKPVFNKVFANAGGTYVEVDTLADHGHNPTGLLRVHMRGVNPQIGPSDGLSNRAHYLRDNPSTMSAVGVAWKDVSGNWKRLAELSRGQITDCAMIDVSQFTERVSFQLLYQGYFGGPALISEKYLVTPGRVEMTAEGANYNGPLQMTWPVLVDDGERKTDVSVDGNSVSIALEGSSQKFTAVGAKSVTIDSTRQCGRNGWYNVAIAEYPEGVPAKLVITGTPAQ